MSARLFTLIASTTVAVAAAAISTAFAAVVAAAASTPILPVAVAVAVARTLPVAVAVVAGAETAQPDSAAIEISYQLFCVHLNNFFNCVKQ
jgi:hypothetical protein